MVWHESDTDIENEWTASAERKLRFDTKSREERDFQERLNRLRMVEKSEMTEMKDENGNTHTVRVTTFEMPKNIAGDPMDNTYRNTQKTKLIANNVERLEANET